MHSSTNNLFFAMLLLTCKFVVIASLAAVFLTFFGHPSYVKFLNQDTVFTETQVKFDPRKPVGITIFAWKKYVFHGWKDNYTFKEHCNETTDFDRVVQCINNGTFKHDDIIDKYTKHKINNKTDVTKNTPYTEDIPNMTVGKSYSINISFAEEDDYGFIIGLKPGYNYSVFIHDPQFYILTLNPGTIPHILLYVDDKKSRSIYFTTTYQKMMDKPKKRCESSEIYSFTACVKNSISRMIGCRLEWDVWSSRNIPICTNFEQLERFNKEYTNLWRQHQPYIVKNTGCLH